MNENEIIERNSKRFISNITHLLCSKCGNDVEINNRYVLNDLYIEKEVDSLFRLYLKCPNCESEYDIGLVFAK